MSTETSQVYKSQKSGTIVEILNGGGSVPQCDGEDMIQLKENTTDAATEKHVPVVEKIDGGYKVSVGSVNHPMQSDHFIEWIELLVGDDVILRKHLKPDQSPEAVFQTDASAVTARAYCNLHGLWKS